MIMYCKQYKDKWKTDGTQIEYFNNLEKLLHRVLLEYCTFKRLNLKK